MELQKYTKTTIMKDEGNATWWIKVQIENDYI